MALFGGFQERREKKALEHYLAAASIDATEIEELKKACPDAQSLLHGVLKQSTDRDKRFRALLGLQVLGITPGMVTTVLDALRDEDDFVQEAGAKILAACPQHADVIVPALTTLYTDSAGVRPIVLHILSEFGPAGRPAARSLVGGLRHPVEALGVARCLVRIGAEDLDPIDRAMVDVLTEHRNIEDLNRLAPASHSMLEAFLLACIPWRVVDAIPAWRRVLEAYAEVCERPSEPVARVLTELVQYTDWKLRGEVGAQFMEMSRAKTIAEKMMRPQA